MMVRTLVTLLAVCVVVWAVYASLRALLPQFPQINGGVLGVTIGLIAGGIIRWQGSRAS